MKSKALWILLFIVNINFPINIIAAEMPATQQNSLVLPPIRRIGLDIVDTNADEFRNFMRKQDRLLYGVVALPYNEQDIKKTLATDLEHQTKNTGRFWDLSFTQFLLPSQNSKAVTNLKHKLELDYNLDAWLKPTVTFSPDQTLVRLALRGIGSSNSIWAREDILLEAQASEDKISAAFSEALSRIISTIGNDGRVTYTRDNLMTVDFGTERGIERGEKIIAGYVILTSFLPQSGEFLRSQRIPLYELKVLEARKGSSLCEITAIDKIKLEQITKMFNEASLVMLAWRSEKSEKLLGWQEPYDPQTAPILGASESGFGVPIEKKSPPAIPNNMIEPPEMQTRVASKAPQQVATNANQIMPENPETQDSQNEINKRYFKKRATWSVPNTWNLIDLTAGTGITLGAFAEGEASAFPATLINRLDISSFMQIDSKYDLYAKPYAQYAFFNGSNISGTSYFLGTTIYNAAWSNQGQNLYFGGGVEITGGTISNSRSKTDISNFVIDPSIRWESSIPSIGGYNIEGSFSIFDIIQSYPVWSLRAEIQPFELMTKQVAFDVGMKRYTHDWIEFSLGLSWNFAANN